MSHLVELSSVNGVDDGSVHHHVSGSVLPHSNNFTTSPPIDVATLQTFQDQDQNQDHKPEIA